MPVTAAALNASQVFILRALAKASNGLTREELEREVGSSVICNPFNLGPAYKETLEGNAAYAGSLWGMGLVRPIYDEGDDGKMVPFWHATAAGRRLADSLKTRERPKEKDRVDPEVLDPVVRKFRATRTYGIESWTDEDIQEVRSKLGKHGEGVSLEALRIQIANRRKRGAFADPLSKVRKACEKVIREFGPDGTILALLTPEQVEELEELAAGSVESAAGEGE